MQTKGLQHNVPYVGDWVINVATGRLVQVKSVPTGQSDVALTDVGEVKYSDLRGLAG